METQQDTQITHLQHCLQTLTILSKMCETLGPDLLENTGHILSFAKATFERACQSLSGDDDAGSDAFETESLSMGFGLVSAVMTGEGEVGDTIYRYCCWAGKTLYVSLAPERE